MKFSVSLWDRCPLSIVTNLRSNSEQRNPIPKTTWDVHSSNYTLSPYWLDDSSLLLRHVDLNPAVGW